MDKKFVPWVSGLGLLLAFALSAGCGPLGRDPIPGGPPTVVHVVFDDQNRGVNPDLLNSAPPRSCDITNPCPPPVQCGQLFFYGGSTLISATFPFDTAPDSGRCHDPENITEVAPSLLRKDALGTGVIQPTIRVCFNKQIDTTGIEADDATITDPTILRVLDDNNNVVAGTVIYDRTGSTQYTSDPGFLPYGPALVFEPDAPLLPSTRYQIQLSPSIKARDNGQPIANSQTSFSFTTEPFLVLRFVNCPVVTSPGLGDCANADGTVSFPDPDYAIYALNGIDAPQDVATDQALEYQFNSPVDTASLDNTTVTVVDSTNTPVPLAFSLDASDRVLDITPAGGAPWAPGTYTLAIKSGSTGVRSALNPAATLQQDFTVDFTVVP